MLMLEIEAMTDVFSKTGGTSIKDTCYSTFD